MRLFREVTAVVVGLAEQARNFIRRKSIKKMWMLMHHLDDVVLLLPTLVHPDFVKFLLAIGIDDTIVLLDQHQIK